MAGLPPLNGAEPRGSRQRGASKCQCGGEDRTGKQLGRRSYSAERLGSPDYTLTVGVEGVNSQAGNGWRAGIQLRKKMAGRPERCAARRWVPAHPGIVNVEVPNLPAGDCAVALTHDVSKNHKLAKSWAGVPKERWGMSNNLHTPVKTPSFATARFLSRGSQRLHVRLQ